MRQINRVSYGGRRDKAAFPPYAATQVRFRKGEEIDHVATSLRSPETEKVKILTSCPSCLQGMLRYSEDSKVEADYIVVELAKLKLGENWMAEFVAKANAGGIEKVML